MKQVLPVLFLYFSFLSIAQNKLEGAWVLTKVRLDNTLITSEIPEPGPYQWIFPNMHWLFKDQKIYEVDYPCCKTQISHFVEEKEILLIKGINGAPDERFMIGFQRDTLLLQSELSYGSMYYLVKDTLPVEELYKFHDGYINPACLYGDWEIPVGEVSVEYDAINVWYPWKMKEQIHVEAKNLHHYWANNRFYLEVDGVKRPFTVESVSLQDRNMILIPGSWVKEYIKKQKPDPYQVSNVWLRRISE